MAEPDPRRRAAGAAKAAGPVARILRNARSLGSGKALGGLLSLAYLAIAFRSLGPEGMGVLTLAHAYAMVVAGLARFQSWQAVIHFGAPMLQAGDATALKRLLRYTIRLDLLSAAACVAVALAALPVAAHFLGWDAEVRGWAAAYCLAAPFLIAATPTGVLRLFDRFRLLGWQLTLMPAVRFVGACALWAAGGGLAAFLAVWIVSAVLHGSSLWALGLSLLRREGLVPRLSGRAEQRASGAWLPFMLKTNLSSSLALVHRHLPLLIVGGVLGPAAAGFLRIAYNLANVLSQPVMLFNHASFPELSRIVARDGRGPMLRAMAGSVAAAIGIAAPLIGAIALFRTELSIAVGGEEFAQAAPLVALMALAQAFVLAAHGLESATLALGRAGAALAAQIAGAAAHMGVLVGGLQIAGVIAAPIAVMAGWLVVALVLTAILAASGGPSTPAATPQRNTLKR